ncbi:SMP-30/gluconolactonase/LRE family protein [Sulfitobacter sp. F26169L]|uniref:SMP-30/gluconolactonase/LRE family protein n=1 Tax=Sulfitobacter sp. F26169L TaxID=2996015 RepID=UPI0022608E8C|nr:SMP-30/gluconolactonase/LRE family protein [Sulfitobacter sp. F26169L]MCX7568136.1 SMP-30/gluconolactonase/LRE family protein [Sulfitobacter sp. F26169L]
MSVFDHTQCQLGEGPLWHPERQSLFWFDVLGRRLHGEGAVRQFDECVSAAGWIDHDHLLIASETRLFTYHLETGAQKHIAPLEANNPVTRSNDGRADPFGGFWIGSMGKDHEKFAGAIHRYYRGTVETLFSGLTVANAICFTPDKRFAHYTDTFTRQIMRVELDGEGWPKGAGQVFIDTKAEGLNPDGAVVDTDGCLWVAQWGAARVARYGPDGQFMGAVSVAAKQASCPAFGGADLSVLFITSAATGLDGPDEGKTFAIPTQARGQREHRVIV